MRLCFVILLYLLSACKGANESAQEASKTSTDTTIPSKATLNKFIVDTTAYRDLLQGIWAKDEDSNAAFQIKGDSLFYFEDPMPVYYEINQDSFQVLIDGKKYSSRVIALTADSFKRVEYGELITLYKRR